MALNFFKKKDAIKVGSPTSPSPMSGGMMPKSPSKQTNVFASTTTVSNETDSMAKLIHPDKLYDDKPNTTNFPGIGLPNDPFLNENRIFNEQDFLGSYKRKSSTKANIKIDKGSKIDREGWLVKEGRVVKNWKKRWFILSGNTLAYYTAKSNKIKGSIPLDTCIIRIAKNRTGTEHLNCLELINTAVSETAAAANDDEDGETVRTLFFDATDDKDRQEWFIAITNKISLLKYQRQMKLMRRKDDQRVINLFDTPTLKDLDLSQEEKEEQDKKKNTWQEVCVAIKEPIRLSIYLQTINFENAGIGNNGVKELAEALRENKSVQKLNLSGNNISDAGIGYLASMLSVNTTLTNLDLSHNGLSDAAMKVLCDQALRTNTSINLKRLTLHRNQIGDKGVEALVDALITNTKLRQLEALELGHNQIGDAGCEFIAKLIDNLTQNAITIMTIIDVGHNNIGNDGAKALSKSMSANKSVKSLNLEFNQIGYAGTKDLAFAVVKNTKIEKLQLGGNRLGEQALYLLANTSMSFPQFVLTSK